MQSQGTSPRQHEHPSAATCWALLERIANSPRLARASRLRDLLLFVGTRSLKEGCERVREEEIGEKVFGRPSGYDTNADNIVRVNVSELRKRIDAYFEAEGSHETVIMEVPRGIYVPAFRYRSIEPAITSDPQPKLSSLVNEPTATLRSVEASSSRRHWLVAGWIVSTVAMLVLATGCVSLWLQNRNLQRALSPWMYEPELKGFWSTFLDSPLNTDIILPDASFGQIQLLVDHPITLQDYLSRNFVGQFQSNDKDPEKYAMLSMFSSNSLVTPSSVRLSDSIQALDPRNKKVHIYLSNEYRPASLNTDNLILIGVQLGNPWMDLYEDRLNFAHPSSFESVSTVTNRSPQPGEKSTYISTASEDYCAIAYLPNSGHPGKILIIQGTNPPAFEAAKFFLLSNDQLSKFRHLLHVSELPYFEVLLKVSWVEGTPLNATVVAYRAYPNLH